MVVIIKMMVKICASESHRNLVDNAVHVAECHHRLSETIVHASPLLQVACLWRLFAKEIPLVLNVPLKVDMGSKMSVLSSSSECIDESGGAY